MLRRSRKYSYTAVVQYIFCIALLVAAAACKKYVDEPGNSDPRLSRKYCNDPEAVNFNRDFPGTADNSVCFYPSDVFTGQYAFTDSVFDGANKYLSHRDVVLRFSAESRTKISIFGFCDGSSAPLRFTANRALRAQADTTILNGQPLCRQKDTLSGYITQASGDSTRLKVYLTVVSDTGTTFHQGTAYRQ